MDFKYQSYTDKLCDILMNRFKDRSIEVAWRRGKVFVVETNDPVFSHSLSSRLKLWFDKEYSRSALHPKPATYQTPLQRIMALLPDLHLTPCSSKSLGGARLDLYHKMKAIVDSLLRLSPDEPLDIICEGWDLSEFIMQNVLVSFTNLSSSSDLLHTPCFWLFTEENQETEPFFNFARKKNLPINRVKLDLLSPSEIQELLSFFISDEDQVDNIVSQVSPRQDPVLNSLKLFQMICVELGINGDSSSLMVRDNDCSGYNVKRLIEELAFNQAMATGEVMNLAKVELSEIFSYQIASEILKRRFSSRELEVISKRSVAESAFEIAALLYHHRDRLVNDSLRKELIEFCEADLASQPLEKVLDLTIEHLMEVSVLLQSEKLSDKIATYWRKKRAQTPIEVLYQEALRDIEAIFSQESQHKLFDCSLEQSLDRLELDTELELKVRFNLLARVSSTEELKNLSNLCLETAEQIYPLQARSEFYLSDSLLHFRLGNFSECMAGIGVTQATISKYTEAVFYTRAMRLSVILPIACGVLPDSCKKIFRRANEIARKKGILPQAVEHILLMATMLIEFGEFEESYDLLKLGEELNASRSDQSQPGTKPGFIRFQIKLEEVLEEAQKLGKDFAFVKGEMAAYKDDLKSSLPGSALQSAMQFANHYDITTEVFLRTLYDDVRIEGDIEELIESFVIDAFGDGINYEQLRSFVEFSKDHIRPSDLNGSATLKTFDCFLDVLKNGWIDFEDRVRFLQSKYTQQFQSKFQPYHKILADENIKENLLQTILETQCIKSLGLLVGTFVGLLCRSQKIEVFIHSNTGKYFKLVRIFDRTILHGFRMARQSISLDYSSFNNDEVNWSYNESANEINWKSEPNNIRVGVANNFCLKIQGGNLEALDQIEETNFYKYVGYALKRIGKEEEFLLLKENFRKLSLSKSKGARELSALLAKLRQKEKESVEREYDSARAVQNHLIAIPETLQNLDIRSHYIPASHTGGDWIGYHLDSSGEIADFFMADITGHGLASAMTAGVLCGAAMGAESFLSHCGNHEDHIKGRAVALLESMNQTLYKTSGGDKLATAVLLSIHLPTGLVVFANAGHPAPLHFRASDRRVSTLIGAGSILGLSLQPKFAAKSIHLSDGDALYTFTDGLFENSGKSFKDQISQRQILRIIGKSESLETCHDSLMETMKSAWGDFNSIEDDVSIMGIRWNKRRA